MELACMYVIILWDRWGLESYMERKLLDRLENLKC